ncbi:MAG: hypothetical protein KJ574_04630 [Nanoarchaeota archaeon]|nr:hypothetical protein [Nanoarchaeota archaeon]
MRKRHIDAFHKEAEHLKKKEEQVLFKIHKWEIKHKHFFGNLKRLLGVLFGIGVGSYISYYKLVFLRDALILTFFLLILSYLITHHNKRRMFNEKSLILSLEHTLVLYAISVVIVSFMVLAWPWLIESLAEMLLTLSTGAFFGAITHSYT